MSVIRLLALISLLAASFAFATDDGPFIDPNGRPSSSCSEGGGAMDPNGYSICVDPNG